MRPYRFCILFLEWVFVLLILRWHNQLPLAEGNSACSSFLFGVVYSTIWDLRRDAFNAKT